MDIATFATLSASGLAAVGLGSAALLKAWNGWLELKRLELHGGGRLPAAGGAPRSEIARLRERVRRLEAIASGSEA